MSELEGLLRRELERKSAPAGFADRVLERAAKQPSALRVPQWLAIAAALIVIASIGLGLYEHQRAAQATEARDQLLTALEITASAVERTRTKIIKTTRGNI